MKPKIVSQPNPILENTLDVANCTVMSDDILDHNVYMCPAKTGQYSHDRCRYFGMYRNKAVQRVAVIKAVKDLQSDTEHSVQWINTDDEEQELVRFARKAHRNGRRADILPIRVFVLGTLYVTDFIKDTPGGMFGSKRYFDVSGLRVQTAGELAKKLNGRTWSGLLLKDG